jgi:hypothetical protein
MYRKSSKSGKLYERAQQALTLLCYERDGLRVDRRVSASFNRVNDACSRHGHLSCTLFRIHFFPHEIASTFPIFFFDFAFFVSIDKLSMIPYCQMKSAGCAGQTM